MQTIFVTGASGFVGQAIVKALLSHGYAVRGLSRSAEGIETLKSLGAEAVLGDVFDAEMLSASFAGVDAVIHTAFNHDFSRFMQNCRDDYQLIQTMSQLLKDSSRPLIVTSGLFYTGLETNTPKGHGLVNVNMVPRAASDESAMKAVAAGANVRLIGLAQVHNQYRFGLISYLFKIAADKGFSAYVNAGDNLWAGVHLDDVATLYRLVLEGGRSGEKYMAAADSDLPFQQIAQQIGGRLKLPVKSITPADAQEYFGGLAHLAAENLNANSDYAREKLGWKPSGPSLYADMTNAVLPQ